jgi:hypothetical protein
MRSPSQCRPLRWLAPLAGLWAATCAPALAQDAPAEEAEGPPPVSAPTLRAVGFRDLDDGRDCDLLEARYGRCIEEVAFSSPWDVEGEAGKEDYARWLNTSELYLEMWDDMARRWFRDGDLLPESLGPDGHAALPPANLQWEASFPDRGAGDQRGRVFSLPDEDAWLGAGDWQPGGSPAPLFRAVASLSARSESGALLAEAAPQTILIDGRFAERLGFNGRAHPYELMDGNPRGSGPFFEQVYPFERALYSRRVEEEGDYTLVPLKRFDLPRYLSLVQGMSPEEAASLETPFRPVLLDPEDPEVWGDLVQGAAIEFEAFYRLVAVQIAQYAVEEYTDNQMRVLAALTAMNSPPGALEQRTGLARNLVAAALGQTDDEGADQAVISQGLRALDGGIELNYSDIPPELVDAWLEQLRLRYPPDEDFYEGLTDDLFVLFGDLLRGDATPQRSPLKSLESGAIMKWIQDWMRPGRDRSFFAGEIRSTALQRLVSGLPKTDRDDVETGLLLEQVDLAISGALDPDGGKASPAQLVATTSSQWREVLNRNRYEPDYISQGRGAVDPTAICTTLDGREALDEPSFQSIEVDLLAAVDDAHVEACAEEEDPQGCLAAKALWDNRELLPFVQVDDPRVNRPELTPLVGLPGERTLYRIRWTLWSGWHLFWAPEALESGELRLALRTGAICEDTVLTSPDLVATLTRAALLDGPFRPTVPVRGRVKLPEEDEEAPADPDAALAGGQEAASGAASGGQKAAGAATAAAADPGSLASTDVSGKLDSLGGADMVREDESALPEPVKYVRRLMQAPLLRAAEDQGGVLLVVFDSTDGGERVSARDFRPHTPYTRDRRRAGDGEHVHTAAWSLYLDANPAAPSRTLVSPAFRPRESVETDVPKPRWKRNRTLDWTFTGGLGGFPLRGVYSVCDDDAVGQNEDVVQPCYLRDSNRYGEELSVSEGFSADFSALTTLWIFDNPRLAFEAGLEGRLDAVHGGDPVVADQLVSGVESSDLFAYSWTWRPQGGVLLGLRHAPLPGDLNRRWSTRYPWGSERPDGTSDLQRLQYGLRLGFLTGPTFDGLEGTGVAELWTGWSLRSKTSPHAPFTPYHPALVLGPYARYQVGFPLTAGETRYLELSHSHTVIVGARVQLRLKQKASAPELP